MSSKYRGYALSPSLYPLKRTKLQTKNGLNLRTIADIFIYFFFLFVLRFLQPSQPNGVMSRAVSLPNHSFTGQAKSSKLLTSIEHILSPETDRL